MSKLAKRDSDFENESHLSRKLKADAARKAEPKNFRDRAKLVAEMVEEEDEEEDLSIYARYIK